MRNKPTPAENVGKKSTTVAIVLICVTLVIVIQAIYLQVGNHPFFDLDDPSYVTENVHVSSGVTGSNILWAFTSVDAANWHPVTWLSHMVDVEMYGLNPRGHHITNVIIHTVSSLLLLLLLFNCTGSLWKSSFVAALFALHPLHVESVAWIAERKDVLSAFFWFLTLCVYARYTAKRDNSRYLYLLCFILFLAGLMSKPMVITLPIIMLLMDFWPLNRFRLEEGVGRGSIRSIALNLVKEKIPFFGCSLLSGIVTIFAQHSGGAVIDIGDVSYLLRVENALTAYVKYICKTVWPQDLAVYYPIPSFIPTWQAIGSLFILLVISVAVLRVWRRYPYLPMGWFWFLITLVPVIGLVQVGGQSMADRYSYLPLVGLFIMGTWGVSDLTQHLKHRHRMLAMSAGAVLIALSVLTWQQLGYWRDNILLNRHTLQVTTDNTLIHNNLGLDLSEKGDLDGAISEFRAATQINPDYMKAHHNLGFALAAKGDFAAAISEYRTALRLDPDFLTARNNLGIALCKSGDPDAAIQEFQLALKMNPDYTKARINLGIALAQKERSRGR